MDYNNKNINNQSIKKPKNKSNNFNKNNQNINIKENKNSSNTKVTIIRSGNIVMNSMISNKNNNENYNYYCPVCYSKKIHGICKCHSIEKNPKKHKRYNSQCNPRNNNNF